jgi:hypothetical protein
MESDNHDAPRWEEAFTADHETAVPDPLTQVDDEPWAVYRGAGAAAIAPTYAEAYLEHLDAEAGNATGAGRRRWMQPAPPPASRVP